MNKNRYFYCVYFFCSLVIPDLNKSVKKKKSTSYTPTRQIVHQTFSPVNGVDDWIEISGRKVTYRRNVRRAS